MAETLYAFTDINHGYDNGETNALGQPVIKTVSFVAGDVFKPDGFTKEQIAGLIEAGALSRVSPVVAEAPPLTVEDADAIAAPVEPTKPTK
jgi:hypothetical protein